MNYSQIQRSDQHSQWKSFREQYATIKYKSSIEVKKLNQIIREQFLYTADLVQCKKPLLCRVCTHFAAKQSTQRHTLPLEHSCVWDIDRMK